MVNLEDKNGSDSFRSYNLSLLRDKHILKEPAPHQKEALTKLAVWYGNSALTPKGAILVLPTGGGKTFTACHFTCRNALSDGYKVLWLAHTHHLLEQARNGFDGLVQLVSEPKRELSVRIVSGATGHFPIHSIRPSDDVVIASLQSVARAFEGQHDSLIKFVESSGGKLLVIFDEAHHSPAPSYRRLLQQLREKCSDMVLLGLTATPTYTDDKKRGWLAKLFPQGIVHQDLPQKLMAAGILAKPRFEEARTSFEAKFTDREYAKWIGSNRDIPEDVITELASNRERNEYIASYYLNNQERFGKTIIFADRWIQCEAICAILNGRGARAGAIYSHTLNYIGTPEERNRRSSDENAKILGQFHRGELDVLLNVRMLTEGTDVPDVGTVFLTRQTTSQILLTQMIGRALRGPQFGGTKEANIVSFIDDWKQRISWAAYDQIAGGTADDSMPEYGTRPPVQLISIELVRRLAKQMDSGVNVNASPFREYLPVGWYRVEYEASVENSDDVEPVRQLVMIFEQDKALFDGLISALKREDLSDFENPAVHFSKLEHRITEWEKRWFAKNDDRLGVSLTNDILSIARHMAQNDLEQPVFFPFERREEHNLDSLAQQHIDQDLGDRVKQEALQKEFVSENRFWRAIYPSYEQFKSHYDGCINRILQAEQHGFDAKSHRPKTFTTPETIPDREPSEELKEQVKRRDKYCCLCCGSKRRLEVDHTSAWYSGGRNHLDNLQTLCKVCNAAKSTDNINFRNNHTILSQAPDSLMILKAPSGERAKESDEWEMFLRRVVNFFYQCSATDVVTVGERGDRLRNWGIRLLPGNDPAWIEPHLLDLATQIREAREEAGYSPAPDQITVNAEIPERKEKPERQAEDTLTLAKVLAQIKEVEGFEVCIENRGGRKVRGDWAFGVSDYPYERAANGDWTVDTWKHYRFFKTYPDFHDDEYKVFVIDGNGEKCAGQRLLRKLRETL